MDFQLSEDQKALRDGVRSFCEGRVPADALAALAENPGCDASLWTELSEMGVFNLRISEQEGGVGLGMADAVLVFAELGRRLVPGPLIWTHLAAGLIEGASTGEVIIGGLDRLGSHAHDPILIEHLESIDSLIVLGPNGVERVDPSAIEGTLVKTPMDPMTPLHHVKTLPKGETIADSSAAGMLRLEGATLASAQLLGIAETTLELATDYAKKREQFGRPIGGFQAIKHMLADMFVNQEVARSAVYAAGATLDDPEVGHIPRAVSSAKLTAGEGALKNSRACIQIHGGMGFTWEIPAHYYLKRTWVLNSVFGTTEEHADRSAQYLAQRAAEAR